MDYSKTIIYKIEHIENDNLVYVGHTTNWDKRKYKHKSCCNNEKGKAYNLKVYQMIRENGGWNAFKMIEVEKYPCKDRREAEKRECEVMKELKANMNRYMSYKADEDYYENNKEKFKEYYENNKEKIKEQQKKFREINKEKLNEKKKEYRKANKDKTKKYYENNKERIMEQHKEYYEREKHRLIENNKQI